MPSGSVVSEPVTVSQYFTVLSVVCVGRYYVIMSETVKQKLTTLMVEEKRKLIQAVDESEKKKCAIAKEFGIPSSLLSKIKNNFTKYECVDLLNKVKRNKKGEYDNVDECVLSWLKQCRTGMSQ